MYKRQYDAVSILRNFYGPDIYLNTAPQVAGIPASFPGYNLSQGSRGDAVRTIQRQLNAIANNYPAIPKVQMCIRDSSIAALPVTKGAAMLVPL